MNNISDYISEHVLVGSKLVWFVLLALLGISAVEVFSASSNMTYQSNEFWRPALNHASMIVAGLAACCIVARMNMTVLRLAAVLGYALGLCLLLCAMLFGERVNGATRWVFGLQPSEIAKGVLVMMVALILSHSIDPETHRVSPRGAKWCVGFTVLYCALIAPENLSTAGLLFGVVVMMLFVGRVSVKQLAILTAPLLLVCGLGYAFLRATPMEDLRAISEMRIGNSQPLHRLPTWANRVRQDDTNVSAANYPINEHLQVAHAKIAVATSGFIGRGPGRSVERDYLPQAFSDFIFAIILEEGGLVAGIFVVMLYVGLLFRVGLICRQCRERFPQLLAMGLTLLIVTQAMFNICVAVGLLPVTGQQLPLVSRGGTGIVLNCCYVGMILAMTRIVQREERVESGEVRA